jgi:hypothetical protein
MNGLTSIHSRPAAAALHMSGWRSRMIFVAKLWHELFREFLSSYRPELHYMRGPGPRWLEKHGAVLAHGGGIPAVGRRQHPGGDHGPRHHSRIARRRRGSSQFMPSSGVD